MLFFEEQPVVFEGFRGRDKILGKVFRNYVFFILPFKKVDRIVSILLMNCSFTRLISSYEDDDRHFIKMCFQRITGTKVIWKPSSLGG